MTEEELQQALSPMEEISLIAHKNMKDVAFWPLSVEFAKDHYSLNGIWYNTTYGHVIATSAQSPARETIKIKKTDLPLWSKIVQNTK